MVKNIANLIKVKTIVTFSVIAVFVFLSITGQIPTDRVMDIVLMVVAFYFGTQSEKKGADL